MNTPAKAAAWLDEHRQDVPVPYPGPALARLRPGPAMGTAPTRAGLEPVPESGPLSDRDEYAIKTAGRSSLNRETQYNESR